MLRSKEGPNQWGLYSLQYISYFCTIFLLINYSLRDPHYIRPEFFYFRDSHLRPTFRDPHFATHVSRPTCRISTCDSHSRLYSRLPFTTRFCDSTRDSRSRLLIAPQTETLYFLSQLLLCDPTTDGWTVLTPQHHLPSIPTPTLTKKFGTFSLAWPLPLSTTYHHVHYL